MLIPFADVAVHAGTTGWGIADIAIALIVIIGIVAVVIAFIRWSGMVIPPIVVQVAWIVFGVIVAVLAIKIIASL